MTSEFIVDADSFNAAIAESFKDLAPAFKIICDAPHAAYLEYGSYPAEWGNITPTLVEDPQTNERITQVNLQFREWAGRKFGYSGKTRARVGDKVYHNIMEKGMVPHPFMRAALYDAQNILAADIKSALLGGRDPEDISECKQIFNKCLRELLDVCIKNSIESLDLKDTGELIDSIKIEDLDDQDREGLAHFKTDDEEMEYVYDCIRRIQEQRV